MMLCYFTAVVNMTFEINIFLIWLDLIFNMELSNAYNQSTLYVSRCLVIVNLIINQNICLTLSCYRKSYNQSTYMSHVVLLS